MFSGTLIFSILQNHNSFFSRKPKVKGEGDGTQDEQQKRVPLSLEELLAKKKAEEEAQSKVRSKSIDSKFL